MTFQEKRFHICGGNFLFLRWKLTVPPLELESSSLGTRKFPPWN